MANQRWSTGDVQSYAEEYLTPVVSCQIYWAMSEWHFGENASCHALLEEAISIAKELKDMNSLAQTLSWAAGLAANEMNLAEVDRFASDLIELSTRHNFAFWLALGLVNRGWARSVSGDSAEGIAWIEQGIKDLRATGVMLSLPISLEKKAGALYLADRTAEALEALKEAEAILKRTGEGNWRA